MSNISLYFKSHIMHSSSAAIELAEINPSDKNLKFAEKLLAIKMADIDTDLREEYIGYRKFMEKTNKYTELHGKLNNIMNAKALHTPSNTSNKANSLDETQLSSINELSSPLPMMSKIYSNFTNRNLGNYDNNFFKNKNLTGCKFSGGIGAGIDFSNSNLEKVDLSLTDLKCPKFTSSNLTSAKLCLNSADFTEAVMKNTEISLKLPSPDRLTISESLDIINRYFNDINNSDTIFSMINTISDDYLNLKTKLMRDSLNFISSFPDKITMRSSVPIASILNNITSKEFYLKDKQISDLVHQLIEREFARPAANNNTRPNRDRDFVNRTLIDSFSDNTLLLFMNYINKLEVSTRGLHQNFGGNIRMLYFPRCNIVFTKLMLRSLYSENEKLHHEAIQAYNKYLNLERLGNIILKHEYGNGENQPDWTDKSSLNFILLSKNKKMLIDYDHLTTMLSLNNDSDMEWDHFYLYDENDDNIPSGNLNNLFIKDFKIFKDSYLFNLNKLMMPNLIKSLNLSSYESEFQNALMGTSTHNLKKLVGNEDQIKLSEIFDNVIENPFDRVYTLTYEHYDALSCIYNLDSKNDRTKAETLFCLSAMFCYLSSSQMFGTEDDSPVALRNYVSALMNTVHDLSPSVMGYQFDSWNDRLLGLNDEFTCTSVLASDMIYHARTHFGSIARSILPSMFR